MKTKHVILKVCDRDGESRYVIAVMFKDEEGCTKRDLSREDVVSVRESFGLSEEEMEKVLGGADRRFRETVVVDSSQPFGETKGDSDFDLSD